MLIQSSGLEEEEEVLIQSSGLEEEEEVLIQSSGLEEEEEVLIQSSWLCQWAGGGGSVNSEQLALSVGWRRRKC